MFSCPFELIFVYGARYRLKFIFLQKLRIQLFQHYLLKSYPFLTELPLNLCWKLVDMYVWVYFWTLYSVALIYLPYSPDDHSFKISLLTSFGQ